MRITCNATDSSQTALRWIYGSKGSELELPCPFIFDLVLDQVDPNAVFLAAYLMRPNLFRRTIIEEPKVSAALAFSIASSVTDGPVLSPGANLPVQNDQVHLFVSARSVAVPQQSRDGIRRVLVEQRSSKNWAGRLFSLDHVVVASNYELVDSIDRNGVRAAIAIGLLMCADWKSSQVTVEDPYDALDGAEREVAQKLAGGAGYSLEVVGAAEFERKARGEST